MAKKLTITPGLDLDTDASITRADFTFWFTQALFAGIDRDHFAAGSSPVISAATAPSSPANGQVWHDTTSGAVSVWTGSEWLGIGMHVGATAPTGTGVLWADTTLKLVRRYETIQGITGWHPVSEDYQLWLNGGSALSVGNPVIWAPLTGTARTVTTTALVKSQQVEGVAMEAIANGASGVICSAKGSGICDILADDGEADGAIDKGDLLCTHSVSGECRTAGTDPQTLQVLSGNIQYSTGTPAGAFAKALSTKDATTHLVTAQMLGGVGRGCSLRGDTTSVVASLAEGADTEVEFTSAMAYDSKHLPILGFHGSADLVDDGGTGGDAVLLKLDFKPDGSVARTILESQGSGQNANLGNAGYFGHHFMGFFVDTNDGSAGGYNSLGNFFTYNLTAGVGYVTKSLEHQGYLY